MTLVLRNAIAWAPASAVLGGPTVLAFPGARQRLPEGSCSEGCKGLGSRRIWFPAGPPVAPLHPGSKFTPSKPPVPSQGEEAAALLQPEARSWCSRALTVWVMRIGARMPGFKSHDRYPRCPPVSNWTNWLCHIHITETCSSTKRNEALVHTATWMNLKNIMLGEKCQTKRSCMVCFQLPEMCRTRRTVQTDSRLVLPACSRSFVSTSL